MYITIFIFISIAIGAIVIDPITYNTIIIKPPMYDLSSVTIILTDTTIFLIVRQW